MNRSLAAAGVTLCVAVAAADSRADETAAGSAQSLVARGKYLTTAGDCISCHSAKGGQPLAGGRPLKLPFGTIYPPNITPDRETGIGNWTDDQFYHALHDGIGPNGQYLYPALPYPWYTKVTRDDVLAIKAYLFSVAPVHAPRKPAELSFPFDIREGLVAWRAAFFHAGEFKPDPAKSAQINRGAYLVQGLGHCGECHNGNDLYGASKAAGRLQGGTINDWYAPDITGDTTEGVGSWSQQALATFLKTGATPTGGTALGPMAETIRNSLQYLTASDLAAIAAYLKSTPGKPSYAENKGSVSEEGASLYLSNCAFCHQQNGQGVAGEIPALAGSGAVRARGADDVIRVVLGGLQATRTLAPMPAVGAGMTDQQIADVTNYVRTAWGNNAPANAAPGQVGKLRAETHTVLAVNGDKTCTNGTDRAKTVAMPSIAGQPKGINDANLLQSVDVLIPRAKQAAPRAAPADLVNDLTRTYCPVLAADASLTEAQRAVRLGNFADTVYGQLMRGSARN